MKARRSCRNQQGVNLFIYLSMSFLSHLSVAVKACAAQQLHLLVNEMGVNAVLTAGPRFTPYFLRALSKMCLDPAAEVRSVITYSSQFLKWMNKLIIWMFKHSFSYLYIHL